MIFQDVVRERFGHNSGLKSINPRCFPFSRHFRPHRAETYDGLIIRSLTISIQKDKPFTNSAAQKYNKFFYQQYISTKFFENFLFLFNLLIISCLMLFWYFPAMIMNIKKTKRPTKKPKNRSG